MDKWSVLEIVIVIILLIGLLDRLTGSVVSLQPAPSPSSHSSSISPTDPANPFCGLHLISPTNKATINASFALVGSVAGCNWQPTDTAALYVQVVDANGVPLSSYLPIPITTKSGSTANFGTVIALTTPPTTSTGYVILVPAVQKNDTGQSVRLSVTFNR